MSSVSLLRLSIPLRGIQFSLCFSHVHSATCGESSRWVQVKPWSDNSNISAITALSSIDYLFTFILVLGRMSDFFFSGWKLDISGITLWDFGSYLNFSFGWLIWTLLCQGMGRHCYCCVNTDCHLVSVDWDWDRNPGSPCIGSTGFVGGDGIVFSWVGDEILA